MQQKNDSGSNTLLVAILAGLSGMIVGMLIAPREGKETRRRLQEAMMKAEDQAAKGMEKAGVSLKKGYRHTQDFKDRLHNAWQEGAASAGEDKLLPPGE